MKIILLSISLLLPVSAFAAKITAGDYQGRKEVQAFVKKMAASSAYSEKELIDLFSQVKKQAHLFEKLNKPAERELSWYQYRPIFIKDSRIDQGIDFWKKHQILLSDVTRETGVPEEIVVAIIGVETFYGTYKGKDPVFDSLVTLAFDYPKRAKFFKHELKEFLLLCKEQNFNVRELKGSYAGAMGLPQFISSSYRNFAVDFDGNGQIDLFNSIPDIAGSVANYFVRHGWVTNGKVATPLVVGEKNRIEQLEITVKPKYTWSELKKHGLASRFEIADSDKVALVLMKHKSHSEYWAGFKNFYVITRYNHSELYAMAVYQLAKRIKFKYQKTQ